MCKHVWELYNQEGCKCTICGETMWSVICFLNDSERHIEKLEKELKQLRKEAKK